MRWCYWGYLRASFASRANPWNTSSGATGANSELPLPTEQILGIHALGLLGLPRDYLCQPSKSLEYRLWGYWGHLGATFANRANPWNTGSGAPLASTGLPSPTVQIFGIQTLPLLRLPQPYLCQPRTSSDYISWRHCPLPPTMFANQSKS